MSQFIQVLIIKNSESEIVSACESAEVAHRELHQYVKDNWGAEMDTPMPDDEDEAIEEYFDTMSYTESYVIESCAVIT